MSRRATLTEFGTTVALGVIFKGEHNRRSRFEAVMGQYQRYALEACGVKLIGIWLSETSRSFRTTSMTGRRRKFICCVRG